MRNWTTLLGCWLLLQSAWTAAQADWPGFRGPVDAQLTPAELPLQWGPNEHVRWVFEIPGTGQSSPVVWQNMVYLTSVEGPEKNQCHVTAVDLDTGKQLWRFTVPNASPVESTNYVSKAAPTAVASANGVIALFEGGNLLALDPQGQPRWARNLVEEYGDVASRHGLSSSLLQLADRVIVWMERDQSPYILAIDPQTGDTLWKAEGLGVTSWSSPVMLTVDGAEQLVFSGTGTVHGVSPEDGSTLWKLGGLSGNATPSPAVVGDGLLLLGATDGRGEQGGGKAADSNLLLRVSKEDTGDFSTKVVWRAKRATCSFGSPMASQGLAYFVNRTGIVFCLDIETGEEVYAERTPESCWATPLAVGDRIYLVGQRGTTTVIKAGRAFEILAENRLWERSGDEGPAAFGSGPVQYAVAAVPGHLLIRTGEKLYCLGN